MDTTTAGSPPGPGSQYPLLRYFFGGQGADPKLAAFSVAVPKLQGNFTAVPALAIASHELGGQLNVRRIDVTIDQGRWARMTEGAQAEKALPISA